MKLVYVFMVAVGLATIASASPINLGSFSGIGNLLKNIGNNPVYLAIFGSDAPATLSTDELKNMIGTEGLEVVENFLKAFGLHDVYLQIFGPDAPPTISTADLKKVINEKILGKLFNA